MIVANVPKTRNRMSYVRRPRLSPLPLTAMLHVPLSAPAPRKIGVALAFALFEKAFCYAQASSEKNDNNNEHECYYSH